MTQYPTFPNYIPTILEGWVFSHIRALMVDTELLFDYLMELSD
jgi:hypothetical protein